MKLYQWVNTGKGFLVILNRDADKSLLL